MHPVDCPAWEYQDIPGYRDSLCPRIASVLIELRKGLLDGLAHARDTRAVHLQFFEELTPSGCRYYAGHYRGEAYRCLRYYRVQVPGDSRVGCPPENVGFMMDELARRIEAGIAALDGAAEIPDAQLSAEDKVIYAVAFACHVFEMFLRIHPYANGNGHIGRFLIWAILGRYGYWPQKWPIEPRPPDPPYSSLIVEHRNGNKEPLERFVLQCLGG